jgi:multicomponent Na+:H+ antiporter subunit D
LFLVTGLVDHTGGSTRLSRIGGMVRTTPFLAAMFLVSALSLAGIPPFSGFISKLGLIEAGVDKRQFAIVAVSLVVSFLTLFAMIRIWLGAFWSPPETAAATALPSGVMPRSGGGPLLMVAPTAAIVACSLAIAVAAGPIFTFSERTARDLVDRNQYVEEVLRP